MCREIERMRNDAANEASAVTLTQNVEAIMVNFKLSLEDACKGLNIALDTYLNAKTLLERR